MQIKSNILNKFKRLEKMIVWLRFVPKREDTFNKERLFDFIDRVNECLCNRSYFECEIERKIPSYYGKYEIDYVIQIFYNIDVLIDVDYNYVLVVYEIPLSSKGIDIDVYKTTIEKVIEIVKAIRETLNMVFLETIIRIEASS